MCSFDVCLCVRARARSGPVTLCVCQSTVSQKVFFGQLASFKRPQCGPTRRYKDTLRVNLKQCNIDLGSLTSATSDRSSWRTLCHKAVTEFEDTHVAALVHKPAVRKFDAQPSSGFGVWPCNSWSRVCSFRIGFFAHQKTHR